MEGSAKYQAPLLADGMVGLYSDAFSELERSKYDVNWANEWVPVSVAFVPNNVDAFSKFTQDSLFGKQFTTFMQNALDGRIASLANSEAGTTLDGKKDNDFCIGKERPR